ncbi:MAG: division/cell wall cluster transcriptional repressor MraZ [Spirochaetia bacterium]
MITGEYYNSLDEKGRLLIPSRLRSEISGNTLVLTRGIDICLWLFLPDSWAAISESLIESTSIFHSRARLLQRRIIGPAQEVEIDKAGRINISSSLRDYAKLEKDCVFVALKKYIEIWSEEQYKDYLEESESEFKVAAEDLGEKIKF